jgi:hypothetical protein
LPHDMVRRLKAADAIGRPGRMLQATRPVAPCASYSVVVGYGEELNAYQRPTARRRSMARSAVSSAATGVRAKLM